jgi:hypothetical protein
MKCLFCHQREAKTLLGKPKYMDHEDLQFYLGENVEFFKVPICNKCEIVVGFKETIKTLKAYQKKKKKAKKLIK